MQNKNVVERLKNISHDTRYYLSSHEVKAINHAIKCVELHNALVDALHQTNNLMFNLDNDWSYDEQYKANEGMINKAKELIE